MDKLRDLKSLICENGHLETSILENEEPYYITYCRDCGKKFVDSCSKCNSKIIGGYVWSKIGYYCMDDPVYEDVYEKNNYRPNYCHECGAPYPWVEKKLNDLKEILELQNEEINSELQTKIFTTVEALVGEKNPETSSGITKLKLLLEKLPNKEYTANTLSGILSSEVLEFLKK